MRASRSRMTFHDPQGTRHHGVPTRWRCVPERLATRRQLTALGLRPGGQPIAAQRMRHRGRGEVQVAYLYRLELAEPKRSSAKARFAADEAMPGRQRCSSCGQVLSYVIPRSLGECVSCAAAGVTAAQPANDGVTEQRDYGVTGLRSEVAA